MKGKLSNFGINLMYEHTREFKRNQRHWEDPVDVEYKWVSSGHAVYTMYGFNISTRSLL